MSSEGASLGREGVMVEPPVLLLASTGAQLDSDELAARSGCSELTDTTFVGGLSSVVVVVAAAVVVVVVVVAGAAMPTVVVAAAVVVVVEVVELGAAEAAVVVVGLSELAATSGTDCAVPAGPLRPPPDRLGGGPEGAKPLLGLSCWPLLIWF